MVQAVGTGAHYSMRWVTRRAGGYSEIRQLEYNAQLSTRLMRAT
jgi:hypothetical protein